MKADAPLAFLKALLFDAANRPRALHAFAARYLNARSEAKSVGCLPVVSIFDLVPDASRREVIFKNIFETPIFEEPALSGSAHFVASTTLQDSYCLALLLGTTSAKRILEVGTSYGETSLLLALNSPPDAIVETLDIQSDNPTIGSKFRDDPAAKKIRFQCMSLAELRAAGGAGKKFDFIFIDGDHGFDAVMQDSHHAFDLLAPNGVICWHDYTFKFRDGVVRALDQLRSSEGRNIVKVAYVNLATYRNE